MERKQENMTLNQKYNKSVNGYRNVRDGIKIMGLRSKNFTIANVSMLKILKKVLNKMKE